MKQINNIIDKIQGCLDTNIKKHYLHEPIITDNVIKDVSKCIKSTYLSSNGEYIEKFENQIKKITGSKYVSLINSGTAALFIALKQLSIEGSEVFIPSMTFVATPNSVSYLNGIPHFIDCKRNNPNIDIVKFKKYLEDGFKIKNKKCFNIKSNRYVKALVVVHAFGYPADIIGLKTICDQYNIIIIEDAAGALGSLYKDKHVGTFSKFGIFSFNGNKIITTGMGGAILSKTKKDHRVVSHLISTCRIQHGWKIEHDEIGYNLRMANINASLGYSQIKNIQTTIKKKTKLHNLYQKAFTDDISCSLMESNNNCKPNYWLNNLVLTDTIKNNKEKLIRALHGKNIFVRELWTPQHMLPMYKSNPRMKMTNTIDLWKKTISLPSSCINHV